MELLKKKSINKKYKGVNLEGIKMNVETVIIVFIVGICGAIIVSHIIDKYLF
jgi:hypothetical protein